MRNQTCKSVLVTGGAGYVGAMLVPKLLGAGHRVKVLDWFLFGDEVLDDVKDDEGFTEIKGDIRDTNLLAQVLPGCDAIIHLACISNDPSCELNPSLTRSVNLDAFAPLVQAAKLAGVRRFIYASSSSVYDISDAPNVDEDHPIAPLTLYSRYKAQCEPVLLEQQTAAFIPVILRPATVCGVSRRQRLDVVVNLLTAAAFMHRQITVFGGGQMRPIIHMEDMTDLYVQLLEVEDNRVAGQIFNAGLENLSVSQIAQLVRQIAKEELSDCTRMPIVTTSTKDERSYHISSEKIRRALGFTPRRRTEDAIRQLMVALRDGAIAQPIDDNRYHNVRTMRAIQDRLREGAIV